MPSIQRQNNTLIVTTPAELMDTDWRTLSAKVLERTRAERIKFVILDVGLMATMDSYATRMLGGIAKSLELLGARTVVVGIQPDVALAMSQLGLRLDTMLALDLDEGLAMIANLRGIA